MTSYANMSSETYAERVKHARDEYVPVVSAEEDEAIARRTGRARRVVRCTKCNASVYAANGCWSCDVIGPLLPGAKRAAEHTPTTTPRKETRRR